MLRPFLRAGAGPARCGIAGARRIHGVAEKGFAADASLYDRVRPSYPAAAVAHALGPNADAFHARILEVAAGTGILTRRLLDFGARDVVAVEPVAAMRSEFRRAVDGVPVRDGRADALPFGDESFDVVVVGQAFHWFAGGAALREMGRTLRPGGRLSLLWNLEDGGVPWVRAVRDAYERHDTSEARGSIPQYHKMEWPAAFDDAADAFPDGVDRSFFENFVLTTEDEIWERALSKSYCATLPADAQRALVDEIRAIVLLPGVASSRKIPPGPPLPKKYVPAVVGGGPRGRGRARVRRGAARRRRAVRAHAHRLRGRRRDPGGRVLASAVSSA